MSGLTFQILLETYIRSPLEATQLLQEADNLNSLAITKEQFLTLVNKQRVHDSSFLPSNNFQLAQTNFLLTHFAKNRKPLELILEAHGSQICASLNIYELIRVKNIDKTIAKTIYNFYPDKFNKSIETFELFMQLISEDEQDEKLIINNGEQIIALIDTAEKFTEVAKASSTLSKSLLTNYGTKICDLYKTADEFSALALANPDIATAMVNIDSHGFSNLYDYKKFMSMLDQNRELAYLIFNKRKPNFTKLFISAENFLGLAKKDTDIAVTVYLTESQSIASSLTDINQLVTLATAKFPLELFHTIAQRISALILSFEQFLQLASLNTKLALAVVRCSAATIAGFIKDHKQFVSLTRSNSLMADYLFQQAPETIALHFNTAEAIMELFAHNSKLARQIAIKKDITLDVGNYSSSNFSEIEDGKVKVVVEEEEDYEDEDEDEDEDEEDEYPKPNVQPQKYAKASAKPTSINHSFYLQCLAGILASAAVVALLVMITAQPYTALGLSAAGLISYGLFSDASRPLRNELQEHVQQCFKF